MNATKPELKYFNMRLPKEVWMFLKKSAAAQELSMTDIIVTSLDMYKKKMEKKNKPVVTEE
jgi:predicted HicB family RNase H-like nuclease